ncbi:MAG: hypothetical protein H7326_03255 [Bdellovibrionaceae bacterium]|nr:hypothetical protein [Pseudobdellovibrionaceae bacterium]
MRAHQIILLGSFITSELSVAADVFPRIEKVGSTYNLILSPAMESELKKVSPSFKQYPPNYFPDRIMKSYKFSDKQMLSAVIGDFNGDGKPDAIVQGADSRGDVVFKIISADKGYKISFFSRNVDAKATLKLYFPNSTWASGMHYLEFRPSGAYFPGMQYRGKTDQCPYDGLAKTMNGDGTRTMDYCWKNGDLTWDGQSGD